ncbi:ferric reductase transmembrane component 5 [Fusarium sporotrichioides]|uniref:Ferric reductase transmembrane component 5 n=1 Tax=Fusarium sporotrichioides TaxID=5514 RepID=A0A395RUI6_FUSSP|nr:ferric reductase transmembrane component 5 [Fusarium sporotrichioides]
MDGNGASSLVSRLIRRQGYQSQNISDTTHVVDYWGYAARVVPCTNDPGTCEYFESVYGGHKRGMLYSGILWSAIGGILIIWAIARHFWNPSSVPHVSLAARKTSTSSSDEENKTTTPQRGFVRRLTDALSATTRHYTLPESFRFIFGRTTRLQVIILTMLVIYLTIFSFVGIMYKEWVTPVKGHEGLFQRRSWVGSWSDRLGTFAYALTPFSVMLASRESILSLLTGVPYQSFNFLHRWLGWIIFLQSLVHTIGWTVIEAHHYQPQPEVADKWIKQLYMIWGCVAMILIFLLVVLATPWGIRLTGYEFFRKSHYVLAMVYIGACWGHWQPLKVFMVPGLAIWLVDRMARLVRSWLIHYQYLPDGSMGFRSASADITLFPDEQFGDITRLDFDHSQNPWKPGQHFYLCFPKSSVWQSHPFTPLSLPVEVDGTVKHSYVFRARSGETRKIAQMAAKGSASISAVLQGPYGEDHTENLTPDVNVLCVAGGTGIAYVLPVLLWLASQSPSANRQISLIWSVRRRHDVNWVRSELAKLAAGPHSIEIKLYVTREDASPGTTTDIGTKDEITSDTQSLPDFCDARHPDMGAVVSAFLAQNVSGRTTVFTSGPGGMISDMRTAVAGVNCGREVWKGNDNANVRLVCDDRLEW